MRFVRVLSITAACGLSFTPLLPSCASATSTETHASKTSKTLYERLGGEPAITAVVDDFVARAASDPKVNFTRKGTALEWEASAHNVAHLRAMLVQLIASATGGPQQYQGRGMKEAHAGMQITNAEFDALATDLKATLDKFMVAAKEQEELLAIVGGTRPEVVTVR